MIVAGLQMDLEWERPEENFRRARQMAESAWSGPGGERPRLLVLPEMFATGFSMNAISMAAYAEETRAFLATLAEDLGTFVLGGYAEPGEPLPANACSLVTPDGKELLHYRKLHPFSLAGENEHYTSGDRLATAELDGVRVTPLICYDLRFPEPFRAAAEHTDLFCIIANWPAKRREAWTALLTARAIENQAYVFGVNRVGVGGDEPHSGDSVLIGPQGERVSSAPEPGAQGIVLGKVNPREVAGLRRRFPFLRDRRPRLYPLLEKDAGERDQP